MNRLSYILILVSVAFNRVYAQSNVPIEAFDVSNQILKSGCEVSVQLQVMRWNDQSSSLNLSNLPPSYISNGTIHLNGKMLPIPEGLLQLLNTASRVVEPPKQVACGFVVVTGDGPSTWRTLIRISHGRIESAERMDADGRIFAKTLFFYPSPVILN